MPASFVNITPSHSTFAKLVGKHHDKRHGSNFGAHMRRREEAFFPHSTEHERRIRATDGYNNTSSMSTSNTGLLSGVRKQCRAGGKVLERYVRLASASSTPRNTDRSTSLEFKAVNQANLATEFARAQE
ncbi:hypothetical protein FIBSPDRAFT_881999 [Athelia psychrophila]|uniref:Uncharacterized protein n=1 Tax=Athelia psychrophila TaxID=1759441 RepID=A0A166W056_9AGAM|nr:hypothetical protein FIBSPDRAFT_881999 [Fibularhizoctonia sp. CBS 109695]